MKNVLFLLTTLALFSCSSFKNKKATVNVVHWNIKELTTQKLHQDNKQLNAVKDILGEFKYNLLSINELQYDLPNVPKRDYRTKGRNAEVFAKSLKMEPMEHAISFNQANTGNKAKKFKGQYLTKMTKQARKLADQDNFGLFPGQYSTALISKFPIKEEVIIKDLKWREFNKNVKFSKFRRPNGRRIPTGLELFDKTFTDSIIEIEGKEVHVITLHATPAFHFGNRRSPNYERNRDQLRFLEWYLTGGTDIPVKLPKKYSHIKPLNKDAIFIAMGDWNTSIYANNKGSEVLRRLFKSVNLWMEKPIHTHENQNFSAKRLKLTLDYIAYRGLKLVDAGIYYPNEEEGSCMKYSELPKALKSRTDKISADKCFNSDSVELKLASDHFPIWASFEL
ncbi:endonuclease/exonuclease/phosphatase family protein [Bacteriovorax sp. DB6_IX]|uniref:endonuclease/exonuclease/phosphatase family protein n=1 Tax=Bacteriovorax sp. DB6_IX TaxID=1353530 RepID=UPI00038A53BB|nr:endonuclease/exonuclease/phosphatase family protein [Bacteriovorax sp. DB6_IX]EQC49786.1 endonuclease/exonuclease/phosphatase family protein [Bacteriovorax sp. DB6_IX]